MFKITLIAIGKIKNQAIGSLMADYLKRLQPLAKVTMVELPALSFNKDNHDKIKNEEGEKILAYLAKHDFDEVWLAEETGEIFSSTELSQRLAAIGHVAVVIGGALGLSAKVKKAVARHWSLSKLTLPHEIARLIIVEQVYRAVTLDKGMSYHY